MLSFFTLATIRYLFFSQQQQQMRKKKNSTERRETGIRQHKNKQENTSSPPPPPPPTENVMYTKRLSPEAKWPTHLFCLSQTWENDQRAQQFSESFGAQGCVHCFELCVIYLYFIPYVCVCVCVCFFAHFVYYQKEKAGIHLRLR